MSDAQLPSENPVADLVARCIIALEHDGPEAVDAILAREPDRAPVARRQLEQLVDAGLLDIARDAERQVGPYRIVEPIGRGGMGTVYLAEQREPVHRTVALKVLRKLPWQEGALARFERERDALALVEHPSLCKVYDAGTTRSGQAWIAMEYVRGVSITEHCLRRAMPLEQTLGLFVEVCDAVQHAHHRGIVHRDLKPSNILVRETGERSSPVVIDFGLAKATEGALAEDGLHTQEGWMLGTPGYMSPEQARREPGVDTRTDVYSLGMVLFELLAGESAVDSERLRSATPIEMPHVLEARSHKRPSQIAAAGSGRFGGRVIRGDLDEIVAMATADDPERRYPMPVALAEDIERFLRGEAVLARPPSALYRLSKIVRRHRAAAVAVVAVFVAMAVATATSTWFYARAEASAERAQEHRAHATRAVDEMLAELSRDDFANVPQFGPVRRKMLQQARSLYHAILATPDAEGEAAQRARAHTLVRLGRVNLLLEPDDPGGGAPLLEAQAIYESLPSAPELDGGDRLLCSYWSSRAALAGLDSAVYRQRLREVVRSVAGWRAVEPSLQPLLVEAAVHAAFRFHDVALDERYELFETARAISDHLAQDGDLRHVAEAVRLRGVLADWLFVNGRPEDGRVRADEFRQQMQVLFTKASGDAWPDVRAKILATDGFLLASARKEQAALERFEAALAIHAEGLERDVDPRARCEGICNIELAMIQCECAFGGFARARKIADASIQRLRELDSRGARSPRVSMLLAHMLEQRAVIEVDRGEFAASLELESCAGYLDEAFAITEDLRTRYPRWHQAQSAHGLVLSTLARAYRVAAHPDWVERSAEALASVEESLRVLGYNPARQLRMGQDRWSYARGLVEIGRVEDGIAALERALGELAIVERQLEDPAPAHSIIAQAAADLAELRLDRGEIDAVRRALDRAMECGANAVSRLDVVRLSLRCAAAVGRDDAARDLRRAQTGIDEAREWLADGPAERLPTEEFMAGRVELLGAAVAEAHGDAAGAGRAARAAVEAYAAAYRARPGWGTEELCEALSRWTALDRSPAALRQAESLVDPLGVSGTHLVLARGWAAAGDPRAAIRALERTAVLDPALKPTIADDPAFASLENEPGFRALLR